VALLLVDPNLAPNFAPFPGLFHRHAKQVTPKTPELEQLVELVELLAVFETIISEKLPYMRVVFLFHVGLVVFVVGPRAGLMNAVLFKPAVKMVIQSKRSPKRL
jgi:hypothetical protein